MSNNIYTTFNIDGCPGSGDSYTYSIKKLEENAIGSINKYISDFQLNSCFQGRCEINTSINDDYKKALKDSISLENAFNHINTGNLCDASGYVLPKKDSKTGVNNNDSKRSTSSKSKNAPFRNNADSRSSNNVNKYKNPYDASYNEMLFLYNDVLDLRHSLDVKLQNLHMENGSVYSEYKAYYDQTIYSSVLWTILATSLIYYVFRHL